MLEAVDACYCCAFSMFSLFPFLSNDTFRLMKTSVSCSMNANVFVLISHLRTRDISRYNASLWYLIQTITGLGSTQV